MKKIYAFVNSHRIGFFYVMALVTITLIWVFVSEVVELTLPIVMTSLGLPEPKDTFTPSTVGTLLYGFFVGASLIIRFEEPIKEQLKIETRFARRYGPEHEEKVIEWVGDWIEENKADALQIINNQSEGTIKLMSLQTVHTRRIFSLIVFLMIGTMFVLISLLTHVTEADSVLAQFITGSAYEVFWLSIAGLVFESLIFRDAKNQIIAEMKEQLTPEASTNP